MNSAEKKEREDLIWQCRLSSLYHEHREGFLESAHRSILFIILSSTVLLASVASNREILISQFPALDSRFSFIILILSIVPALCSALDLVFKLSSASQIHKSFRIRYTELEARLVVNKNNAGEFYDAHKEIIKLMAEEPPAYRILLYHCVNLIDIMDDADPNIKISKFELRLRNFLRFTDRLPEQIDNSTKRKLKRREV